MQTDYRLKGFPKPSVWSGLIVSESASEGLAVFFGTGRLPGRLPFIPEADQPSVMIQIHSTAPLLNVDESEEIMIGWRGNEFESISERTMLSGRTVTIERKSLADESLPPTAVTAAERLLMVWPLTIEAWAMQGEDIAQSRLPRHVVHVERRGR